jgi:hypothetical protein
LNVSWHLCHCWLCWSFALCARHGHRCHLLHGFGDSVHKLPTTRILTSLCSRKWPGPVTPVPPHLIPPRVCGTAWTLVSSSLNSNPLLAGH